ATNWIICLSRSVSAPFSASSASAILVLVVVIVLFSVSYGVATQLYQDSRWPPPPRGQQRALTPLTGTQSDLAPSRELAPRLCLHAASGALVSSSLMHGLLASLSKLEQQRVTRHGSL